jgi:hypothetical protein
MKPNINHSPSFRYTDVAWLVVLGFVFGYVLLHPISMVIFGLLDPHAVTQNPIIAGWEQILHSFRRNGVSRDSDGLGLPFCTSAVEAHGGRIWCESVVGKGSCFYFSIPLERSMEEKWMAQTEAQRS